MGLLEKMETTRVQDTNIRPPVTVSETASVGDAVNAMKAAGLGCAVVTDRESRAVGMFTEGMLRHCLNESSAVLEESVASQMVTRFPWVSPTEPVSVVLDAMEDNSTRFLAVLDHDRRVIGLTGQKSFIEFVADSISEEAAARESEGGSPDAVEAVIHRTLVTGVQTQPHLCVSADATVREAMKLMVGRQIACVLVEDAGVLAGVFGDRDVLDKVAQDYDAIIDSPVSSVMSTRPVSVCESDSLARVISVMSLTGYRHVPVVSPSQSTVGIVSPQRVGKFLQEQLAETA